MSISGWLGSIFDCLLLSHGLLFIDVLGWICTNHLLSQKEEVRGAYVGISLEPFTLTLQLIPKTDIFV